VETLHPHTPYDVAELLRAATGDGVRLLTTGGRRHVDKGNSSEVDAELWTTQLDRLVAYEPAEMLAVVEAGVRVRDLQRSLADGGQEWPVDAPDDATVGGVIASGADPVRRPRVGLMRDTVVEMTVVTGDGRIVTSGARTVKNVTGYDVHRVLTGSLGTLGVITQVAIKVRPLPKAALTLVSLDGGLELAGRFLETVPSVAAILAEPGRVVLRLEGWPGEIEEQRAAAAGITSVAELGDDRFPEPAFPGAPIVAQAAVPPSRMAELVEGFAGWRALMGVGTVWVPLQNERELEELRFGAAGLGGIAPVVRGSGGLGDAPVPAGDVHRRLKESFDPGGILAPGRGWGGL
jgi:glycolate dehydrogenase FAD-binding subunit